jgi:hypothetical protein
MSVYRINVGDFFYFGSTLCDISERLKTHKLDYDRCASSKLYTTIRDRGGWESVTITCVAICDDPRTEEDTLIRTHWENPLLLNERRAKVSSSEKRTENAAYYATLKTTSPDKLKDYRKKAYESRKHTESYKDITRLYREAHRQELAERSRLRFADLTREQRDEINRKKRELRRARVLLNTSCE